MNKCIYVQSNKLVKRQCPTCKRKTRYVQTLYSMLDDETRPQSFTDVCSRACFREHIHPELLMLGHTYVFKHLRVFYNLFTDRRFIPSIPDYLTM